MLVSDPVFFSACSVPQGFHSRCVAVKIAEDHMVFFAAAGCVGVFACLVGVHGIPCFVDAQVHIVVL